MARVVEMDIVASALLLLCNCILQNEVHLRFSLSRLVCVLSQKECLFRFLPFCPSFSVGTP